MSAYPPIEPSGTPARRVVLYVEDCEVNSLMMRALFDYRSDLDLVVAEDGSQALRVAPSLHPSLLLLDQSLPDCQGSQLLLALRRIPACRSAPAVVVTADGSFDIGASGFSERWIKPLDFVQARHRLEQLLAAAPQPGADDGPSSFAYSRSRL